MGKRDKHTAKADARDYEEDDEPKRNSSVLVVDSDDEEANEDLSLKIVEKAMIMRAARLNQNDNDDVVVLDYEPPKDDIGVVKCGESAGDGGGDSGVVELASASSLETEAVATDISGVKKKKKKKMKIKSEDKSVTVAEEEGEKEEIVEKVETVKDPEELVESVSPNGIEMSDNTVLRKLLRGPRYFDPPDSGWSATCFNCGEEGHMAVNCPSQKKKKKPCYVCGSLDHSAKQCKKGRDCFICKQAGHQANNCPQKLKSTMQSSKICLKCGDTGHDLFLCRNGYPLDDLKEIQCYICKGSGHLCCSNSIDGIAREVSCYKCGELGHSGLACSRLQGEANNTTSPSSCYRCGESGHFARECTSSAKVNPRLHEEANNTASPTLCYKCGGSGHFARECTRSAKARKRNRETSTPTLNSHKEKKRESKSAPHDHGKNRKRRKEKSEEQAIRTPQKSKHRGGWITDHPGDSSHSRYKESHWKSPPTQTFNNGRQVSSFHYNSTPSSWSTARMHNSHVGTPPFHGLPRKHNSHVGTLPYNSHVGTPPYNSHVGTPPYNIHGGTAPFHGSTIMHHSHVGTPFHESASDFQHRYSASRFQNYNNTGIRRNYDWW